MAGTMAASSTLTDPRGPAVGPSRTIVEAFPDAVAIVDVDGVIVDVNRRMLSLVGRSRDDLVGAPVQSCCQPASTSSTR